MGLGGLGVDGSGLNVAHNNYGVLEQQATRPLELRAP